MVKLNNFVITTSGCRTYADLPVTGHRINMRKPLFVCLFDYSTLWKCKYTCTTSILVPLQWFTAFIATCTSFYSTIIQNSRHLFFGLKLFLWRSVVKQSFTAYINLLWHLVPDQLNHRKDLTGRGRGTQGQERYWAAVPVCFYAIFKKK